MNRREFLKLSGVVGLAAVITPILLPTPQIVRAHDGRLLKGTSDGKLFESIDNGLEWRLLFNFGPEYAITGLAQDRDMIYARLMYDGLLFDLQSTDGRSWVTPGYQPPLAT